jgi:hypothetical protein
VRGVGDLVKAGLSKLGIQQSGCGGCARRQAWLNRLTPGYRAVSAYGAAGGSSPILAPASGVSGRSTIPATSCQQAHVSAAIAAASDGDTVTIPAGNCSVANGTAWTTLLTVTKRLHIQGAGIDQTIIQSDHLSGSPQIFDWNVPPTGLSTLSGITWYGRGINTSPHDGVIRLYSNGSHKQFRLHHCKFVPSGTTGVLFQNLMGLVDHCYFAITSHSGVYVFLMSYQGVGWYGDQSFAQPSSMGTDEALYFEDNDFVAPNDAGFYFGADGWFGARQVFRGNRFTNCLLSVHGTDSGGRERSQRHLEVYSNTLTVQSAAIIDVWTGTRGGTGLFFNNQAIVAPGGFVRTIADVNAQRGAGDPSKWPYWGRCGKFNVNLSSSGTTATATVTSGDTLHGFETGTVLQWVKITGAAVAGYNGTWPVLKPPPSSTTFQFTTTASSMSSSSGLKQAPWDQNADAFGYRCFDQGGSGQSDYLGGAFDAMTPGGPPPGWPNQLVEPVYGWNNTINGVASPIIGQVAGVTVETRDFYNAVKPGYTPLGTHPLADGVIIPPGPVVLRTKIRK